MQYNEVNSMIIFKKCNYRKLFYYYYCHHTSKRYIYMIITFNGLFHMYSACTNTQWANETYSVLQTPNTRCAYRNGHVYNMWKQL